MRGEYKVPGGKLVVVELEVVDERLTNVHLSGDFFLEPDSALEDIDAALTGMPADASAQQLADAIEGALDDTVALIGFTPQAVGIAVRRALGRATGWGDHTFDVIGPVVLDPVMHMALDEVLSGEVAAGRRPPLLRIWDWDASLVVIGSFQSVRNEVDPDAAQRYGIRVARRISGGGAMFMEPGNCITYSLVVPASLVEGLSFEQSYAFLDDWVLGALAEVGVNATYVPLNDIASDKGKIAGAAQKRFAAGSVLHHVTMAYDIDAVKMSQVLRTGREKLSDKGTKSANKRVDPMRSQTGMSRDAVIAAFLDHFRRRYATRDSGYTDEELAAARELTVTKFLTHEWTYRVP
ncbi:lipoate--protein ligase family protein [Nakamurella lactea]|uniref:lipoate--protein ligase family protein n=1 Tax=Nakamurella lactea TaxID=459515 RepID=UPI000415D600|nr:biotin/lipoate A/B protein ligase family protein [Nakamurella lactea]